MNESIAKLFTAYPNLSSFEVSSVNGVFSLHSLNKVSWPRPGVDFDFSSEFNAFYVECDLKEEEVNAIYDELRKIAFPDSPSPASYFR